MARRTMRTDTSPEHGVVPFSTGTMYAALWCRGPCFPLRLQWLKIKTDCLRQPIDTSAKQAAYVYRQLLLPDKSRLYVTDSTDLRKRSFKITVMEHGVTLRSNQLDSKSSVSAVCVVENEARVPEKLSACYCD